MSVFMSSEGGLDRSRIPTGPLSSPPPLRFAREGSRLSDDAYSDDGEEPIEAAAPETAGSPDETVKNGVILAAVKAIEQTAIWKYLEYRMGKETAQDRWNERQWNEMQDGLDDSDEDALDEDSSFYQMPDEPDEEEL